MLPDCLTHFLFSLNPPRDEFPGSRLKSSQNVSAIMPFEEGGAVRPNEKPLVELCSKMETSSYF
jgi:hypothetical protein